LAYVKQLADVISIRVAGSDEERKAADYIGAQFKGFGYSVEQLPAEFELDDETVAELEVVGAKRIPTNSLGFSGSGSFSAPLVAVTGVGRPGDYPASVKGAIALVQRGTLSFGDKVRNAADAGAKGIIVYNNELGEFRGTLGTAGAIPALGVSGEAGQELLKLAALSGTQVRIKVENQTLQVKSRNVLAKAGESCSYVIGGHFDSVPAGPGANDNASGTAATIEAARVLWPIAKQANLCFMAFGAEELGLWGSRIYVRGLSAAERQGIKAMVNLDMVGVGDRWRISGSEALVSRVGEVADALGYKVGLSPAGRGAGGGSDHASFMQAGIPAVFFFRMEDPNYHLATDQTKFIDPINLEQAGRMTVELIKRLVAAG
jgi:aminopeptidase YwaD